MPNRPDGVRGIVLVPQLSRDQIKEIVLKDILEHMEESKEILNAEEEAMMEQSMSIIESIVSLTEPEEKTIEFECTQCGNLRNAYVSEDQVPENAPRPLKTRHKCEECEEETTWESTDYTEIEIE